MEAVFNFEKKFVFSHLALNTLLEEGCVGEEQYIANKKVQRRMQRWTVA